MGTYAKDDYDSAQPGRAGRRHDHAHRNVLPQPAAKSRSRRSSSGSPRPRACRPATTRSTWASRGSTTSTEEQLREIVERGIASFKIFLAYKGAFGVDDDELLQHARAGQGTRRHRHRPLRERDARRRAAASELLAEGKTGPEWHEPSRPVARRGRGRPPSDDVRRTDRRPRLHRPHELHARRSRRPSPPGSAACTCGSKRSIPYLVARRDLRREAETSRAPSTSCRRRCATSAHQDALWNALRSRTRQHRRHRPRPVRLRRPEGDGPRRFHQDPQRHPQRRRPREPALHPRRRDAAASTCTRSSTPPARRRPNSSASSRARARSPSAATPTSWSTTPTTAARSPPKTQQMAVDYSAFEGWEIEGRPSLVTVRGKVQVRDGKFVGQLGHGKLLRASRRISSRKSCKHRAKTLKARWHGALREGMMLM